MESRKNKPYETYELELILSSVPSESNIKWLSQLLCRSESAIEIVYKMAYKDGPFGKTAPIQKEKILKAKQNLKIII